MRATVGPYAPNGLGHTRPTKAGTMGCDPERGSQSPKPGRGRDCGLQLAHMNAESLVIGYENCPVNTSLFLAHTARQLTQAGLR